jgi:hypothetical protein
MVTLQIRVPDKLLGEIHALADRQQWSLAEALCRGAELLLQVYPDSPAQPSEAWGPPCSKEVGWRGLDAAGLREAAMADLDPRLN